MRIQFKTMKRLESDLECPKHSGQRVTVKMVNRGVVVDASFWKSPLTCCPLFRCHSVFKTEPPLLSHQDNGFSHFSSIPRSTFRDGCLSNPNKRLRQILWIFILNLSILSSTMKKVVIPRHLINSHPFYF